MESEKTNQVENSNVKLALLMGDNFTSLFDKEETLPTIDDAKKHFSTICDYIHKYESIISSDSEEMRSLVDSLLNRFESILMFEEIDGFDVAFFNSKISRYFEFLLSKGDIRIGTVLLSIMADLCEFEDNSVSLEYIKRSDIFSVSFSRSLVIDEVNVQNEAQFISNLFSLVLQVIDSDEDPSDFAENILQKTKFIDLVEKELKRDDFDDNILNSTESLSILLQLCPRFVSEISEGMLNLIIRFISNFKNRKIPTEREASHNAFNVLSLVFLDDQGNNLLRKIGTMDFLIDFWGSSTKLVLPVIESALADSPESCLSFIDAGGLRKLFVTLNSDIIINKREIRASLVSIIDSLFSLVPIDSKYMTRLVKKFHEKDYQNLQSFLTLVEYIFTKVDHETKNDEFPSFQLICSSLGILFIISPEDIQMKIISFISDSQTIDFSLISDTIFVRIGDEPKLQDILSKASKALSRFVEKQE